MSKKEEVRQMFNRIAPRYDYLNHFLSMGIDKLWRKRLRKALQKKNPANILDLATGTGDLALELARIRPQAQITGTDIAENMLHIAMEKTAKKQLQDQIRFQQADAEHLPFAPQSFDAATVAFGVRNFENPLLGLQEIHRILKHQGTLMVLEFGLPKTMIIKQIYLSYFNYILPLWGKIFSGSYQSYRYLPESVKSFPYDQAFATMLQQAGFSDVRVKKLSMGIAYLYEATR